MPEDCLNPYSVAKVAGEKLCKMYTDLFGLETVVFRYFNVYGKREPTKGQYAPVVGLFLRQKRAQQPLTIVGDGLQRRDFTHVSDVVDANIRAMGPIPSHLTGTVFNIGTGKNHSVLDLANLISDSLEFIPPRIGESRVTLADTTKSSTVLKWSASRKIEDYIKEQL
jgi:UDP-glucose 4-epimerase